MIQPKVLLLRTGFSLALVYYLKLCVHSSQVMAFQIAEEDVLAWRQADDELCSVANVEFAQLVDPAKLRGILVHPEPIRSKGKLVGRQIGSDDHELVGRRPLVMDEQCHRPRPDRRKGRRDPEVLDGHVDAGIGTGRTPCTSGEHQDRRDQGRHGYRSSSTSGHGSLVRTMYLLSIHRTRGIAP